MTTPKKHNLFLLAVLITASLFFTQGCRTPEQVDSQVICKGITASEQGLAYLAVHRQKARSFKANGSCVFHYFDSQWRKEQFNVKMWFEPFDNFRMQGDIAFDPTGIVVGSNQNRFWLVLKPKEIRGYWWGQWEDENFYFEQIKINPRVFIEVFGIVDTGSWQNWTLTKRGRYDILVKKSPLGKITKEIYLDRCTQKIKRIEQLDDQGRVIIIAQIDNYQSVGDGFEVPRKIKIEKFSEISKKDSVKIEIDLSSINADKFTSRQKQALFSMPKKDHFDKVYRIVDDGYTIEQRK